MLCIGKVIPHSYCYGHYNECHEGSDISQSIGLQGSHSLMEVEVIWYIESQGTGNTGHLWNFKIMYSSSMQTKKVNLQHLILA